MKTFLAFFKRNHQNIKFSLYFYLHFSLGKDPNTRYGMVPLSGSGTSIAVHCRRRMKIVYHSARLPGVGDLRQPLY